MFSYKYQYNRLKRNEKKQIEHNIQELLQTCSVMQTAPIMIDFDETTGNFQHYDIDTNGLDEADIEELNRFVEFLKTKKKQDKK